MGQWNERQRRLLATTFRRLGIAPERNSDFGIWTSQVLNVLGPDSFAEFRAVRTDGKIIWCNFELARQLGFKVPRSNQLTPALNNQLLAAVSFRAVRPKEDLRSQTTIQMYADRYGGAGVRPGMGAGRAGFLPYGNLYVKGVGFTPLFKHDDPDDFQHSHGAVHLYDCLLEAVFGEVNENLFSQGSTRVVAIIDEGREVIHPSGKHIPVALLARTGAQLRPAHLLNRRAARNGSLLDKFIRITRATGQLVISQDKRTLKDIPNVRDTMLRVIDDHARTAAEGFRWRMIHGALSSSNMEMSGAMLDLPTQSTQPRTAPIWCTEDTDSIFGLEHVERAAQLAPAYRALMRNTTRVRRDLYNVKWINIAREMDNAYLRHLQVQLLRAAGLKADIARRIQTDRVELASHFADLILQMVAMRNPGTTRTKSAVECVSVVDVFNLLGSLPQKYFSNPGANHSDIILTYLNPIFRGNRFQVAKKRAAVHAVAAQFAELYRELMSACSELCCEYYDDSKQMKASIAARAAYENEPLDALYSHRLLEGFTKVIAVYRSTGNAAAVSEAIDQRILASRRCVDSLLAQGDSRRMPGGGIELGMRTIFGINYSVKAWNDERQTRRLHVSIPVVSEGNHYSSATPALQRLTRRQIQSLRYRFTTNQWGDAAEVGASLNDDESFGLVIDFEDLCTFPLAGRIEGRFYIRNTGKRHSRNESSCFGGYSFAIPDKRELVGMLAQSAED